MDTKTKLEILEQIIKNEDIIANDRVCILSKSLPASIKQSILMRVTGMIDMAEKLTDNKDKPIMNT